MPLVSWQPWDGIHVENARFAFRTIIHGKHDTYLRAWAEGAAAWGLQDPRNVLYLRFAHEMNGGWVGWSAFHNGNTTNQFIRAWRHVVTIFRGAGATNVRFVWSPNEPGPGSTPYRKLYPGDAYVDWVGFSSYNWGIA